jgi:DNA-directed RNA polymerase subunit RPC12/RpoP
MALAKQQQSYQCDQCGSPNIAALSLLYEQGTRTYSSPTFWGRTQSYSAQGAAPPRPRGYGGPFLAWGFGAYFFFFWGGMLLRGVLERPNHFGPISERVAGALISVGLGLIAGMLLNFRRVSRYNQRAFPRLYSNWAHTYMCRRCGRLLHIPS